MFGAYSFIQTEKRNEKSRGWRYNHDSGNTWNGLCLWTWRSCCFMDGVYMFEEGTSGDIFGNPQMRKHF